MKEQKIKHVIRQGSSVAHAVAEAVQKGRPNLLNYPIIIKEGSKENEAIVLYGFEGGVVVKVYLYNLDQLVEAWRTDRREEWVVTQCDVSYPKKESGKENVTWNAECLEELKRNYHWHHPHVRSRNSITSDIGIFWDTGAQEGFTAVDPECNQSGHHNLVKSIPYKVLIPGSKKEAQEIATRKLNTYYHQ